MVTNWPTRYCTGCEYAQQDKKLWRVRDRKYTALHCMHTGPRKGRVVALIPEGYEHIESFAPSPVWCGKEAKGA